ncbi:hypothetical protein J2T17_001161 [Paenibacillus mucilaginosus]|uniref:hypothetical protein n=1 Tax=Paenibacillus mucilaginosus TaxID=61624 RepID=UPI003D1BBB5E
MDGDLNINKTIRGLREPESPEIDVTEKVMHRIHAWEARSGGRVFKRNRVLRQRETMHRAGLLTAVFLLIAAVSVSAAAIYHSQWNGIEMTVEGVGGAGRQPLERPSFRGIIDGVLDNRMAGWKAVTAEEAGRQLGFRYLSRSTAGERPNRTFGVIPEMADNGEHLMQADEPWLGGVYDLYEHGGAWIVVRQTPDKPMTQALEGTVTLNENYVGGWEKVMETDNTLGVFRQGKESEEKLLVVSYKTHEDQVIRLELSGNAGMDEILRLAQRYTEAGKLAEP